MKHYETFLGNRQQLLIFATQVVEKKAKNLKNLTIVWIWIIANVK